MSDFFPAILNEGLTSIGYDEALPAARVDADVYRPVGGRIAETSRTLYDEDNTRSAAINLTVPKSLTQDFFEAQTFAVHFLNMWEKVDADPNTHDPTTRDARSHLSGLHAAWARCRDNHVSTQKV